MPLVKFPLDEGNHLQVEGRVEKGHQILELPRIDGKWDESLTVTNCDGSRQTLWQINPPAADPTRCFANT